MNDTPRTQARVRYMIDNNISPEGLEHWANGLERELNAANAEIEEKRKDVVWLATEKAKSEARIKRLEEAGNEMHRYITVTRGLLPECTNAWRKAKEVEL